MPTYSASVATSVSAERVFGVTCVGIDVPNRHRMGVITFVHQLIY